MIQNRFDRAIAALVHAYQTNVLEANLCQACAVGNIVAFGMGTKVVIKADDGYYRSFGCENNEENYHWSYIFTNGVLRNDGLVNADERNSGLANVEVTGYSVDELLQVEGIFVKTWRDLYYSGDEDYKFKSLMAVVDLLCEIEERTDNQIHKEKFKLEVA